MVRILLAEDDPDIRHLVDFKLSRAGLHVDTCSDGLTALDAARRNPPDLVMLDIRMPKMSGSEVCRELRADPTTARIPIIMLTGRTRPQDGADAQIDGADDYIVKPFSPRDLLNRVEAALARVTT